VVSCADAPDTPRKTIVANAIARHRSSIDLSKNMKEAMYGTFVF
jgi:hypothetical protein